MKVFCGVFILLLIGVALSDSLTDQQCSDSCESGPGEVVKAKPVPTCPDADGKKVTSSGVEYQLYCTKAVSTGQALETVTANDINTCIGHCTRNPKCESVNYYWEAKSCVLLPTRESPPKYDTTSSSYKLMSAVPTVAASDRFQPTDTCPEADGKVKKVGTVDYKITCDKHNGVPILSTTTADNMAACAQICQRTSGCMLADYSITTKRCDLGAEWKAVPDRPVAGGVSLVPVVNPAIASAPDLKATDVCPAIDKTYKKLEGGKTFKMWCNTASKGANVKTSKQPNREACIKDCASASGTVAINYCTGGTYAQSCQCKSEKEATPSYNYEPQYWWAATLAS